MNGGRRFWISFIILAVFTIVVFYFRKSYTYPVEELSNTIQHAVQTPHATPLPTQYPYYNLTIPYLRSRTYKSTLGSLQQIDQNTTYTSYLTSYTSDGLTINGLLTVPVGSAPKNGWPAIVFVHGYIPPKEYTTLGNYQDYVDYLARSGFVVFKIDLRGNGSSQGTPQGAYYSSGYVIDTLNAYAALQSVNTSSQSATVTVNPNKIGLWGHSMAGNILMRAWAVKPDIPAVVIWAGAGYTYADLMKYKINDPSYQPSPAASSSANGNIGKKLVALYGEPDLSKPFWHDIAPVSFLSQLKGAIQLDQAEDDPVVSINYNLDLIKLLNQTSVPHKMYEYTVGGHNISAPSFNFAMQKTVAFYKKYLQ